MNSLDTLDMLVLFLIIIKLFCEFLTGCSLEKHVDRHNCVSFYWSFVNNRNGGHLCT